LIAAEEGGAMAGTGAAAATVTWTEMTFFVLFLFREQLSAAAAVARERFLYEDNK
jgi:hypothetical protein